MRFDVFLLGGLVLKRTVGLVLKRTVVVKRFCRNVVICPEIEFCSRRRARELSFEWILKLLLTSFVQ